MAWEVWGVWMRVQAFDSPFPFIYDDTAPNSSGNPSFFLERKPVREINIHYFFHSS